MYLYLKRPQKSGEKSLKNGFSVPIRSFLTEKVTLNLCELAWPPFSPLMLWKMAFGLISSPKQQSIILFSSSKWGYTRKYNFVISKRGPFPSISFRKQQQIKECLIRLNTCAGFNFVPILGILPSQCGLISRIKKWKVPLIFWAS